MSPGNLNHQEFDLPYVHPTLPVELKKEKLSRHFSRRQIISGACLLLVILAMVAAFSVTIILGQKFIVEAPPTDTDNHDNNIIVLVTTYANNVPATTPPVNYDPTDGNEELTPNEGSAPIRQDSTSTAAGAMVTSSPTVKSISSVLSTSAIKMSSTLPSASSTPEPAALTERTHIANDDTEERKLPPWLLPARGHHNIHIP